MAEANSINSSSAGIVGNTGAAFVSTAVTNHGIILGGATSSTLGNVGPTAIAGQVLQSAGAAADPTFSTATYPATAGTAGKVLISDGTNIVSSTPTFPNASATAGKILISDGTNFVASTPTFPNTAAGTGTVLRADGTNWAATTATYPATTTINQILYSSAANTVTGLTTANNGALITSAGGVPSIGTVPLAAGGTNNTSFSTNYGVVRYDGSKLVESSTAIIDNNNIYSNTSQPAAWGYVTANINDVTGDGTQYTVIFGSVEQNGTMYATGTGIMTIPTTGVYVFGVQVLVGGLLSGHTTGSIYLNGSSKNVQGPYFNPYAISTGGIAVFSMSVVLKAGIGETFKVVLTISGSTKVVDVIYDPLANNGSYFSAVKVS